MSKDLSKQKRGAPLDGNQQGNNSNDPGHQQQAAEKGRSDEQYKNVETSVNNRSYFGDEYGVGKENEISRDESRSEDENNR